MANANGSTRIRANDSLASPEKTASKLTPAEQRILRIYRAIPEKDKGAFTETLAVICHASGWGNSLTPPIRAVGSNEVPISLPIVPGRIDEIELFGSRKLVRQRDGRSWRMATDFGPPRTVSDDVSMCINAALRAARGQ